jgi:hypothetical protein
MTNPEAPSTVPVAWCQSEDFRNALFKRQSFSGWREQHTDCDTPLYAHPQASAIAPDAAQAKGPSLDEVAELCEEFEFHLEGDGLEILQEMITAAITRWPAPVAQPAAQPINLAELHDPDFSGGLTPSQHLDVLHGGPDPRAAATASAGLPEPDVGHIPRLAEIIREVDSGKWLGDAALAEAILAHPGFSGCHDGPAASAVQGVQADRYEFSVFDSEDCEVAGGIAATLDDAIREGRNYLRQYNQDGPHKLELRRVLVVEWTEDGWHTLSDLTHWQPHPSPPITPSPHA